MTTISPRKRSKILKSSQGKAIRRTPDRISFGAGSHVAKTPVPQKQSRSVTDLERQIAADILVDYERTYGPWEKRNG